MSSDSDMKPFVETMKKMLGLNARLVAVAFVVSLTSLFFAGSAFAVGECNPPRILGLPECIWIEWVGVKPEFPAYEQPEVYFWEGASLPDFIVHGEFSCAQPCMESPPTIPSSAIMRSVSDIVSPRYDRKLWMKEREGCAF